MKWNFVVLATVLAGAGFWWLKPDLETVAGGGGESPFPPPTTTALDKAEVFRKAFWRRPAAGDTVVAAERREWADIDGVQRWQWFLEVEPSEELVAHLRDQNAFNLSPADPDMAIDGAPNWFRFDVKGASALASGTGDMHLVFAEGNRRLFASGTGGGFRRAIQIPEVQPPGQERVARLPNRPPPNPNQS